MHEQFIHRAITVQGARAMDDLIEATSHFSAPMDALHAGAVSLNAHSELSIKWDLARFESPTETDPAVLQLHVAMRAFWDRWEDKPAAPYPYFSFTVRGVPAGVVPLTRPISWPIVGQPLADYIDDTVAPAETREGPGDHLFFVYGTLRHLTEHCQLLTGPTVTPEGRYAVTFLYSEAGANDFLQVEIAYDHPVAVAFWTAFHASSRD